MFGNGQLANVMQQGGCPQRFGLFSTQPHVFAYVDCVELDPLQVVMRGVVFGLNGQSQRFNRA